MKHMHARFVALSALVLGLLLGGSVVRAEVIFISGEYHETVGDLEVKVLGGFVQVQRTWFQGRWHFNRAWNPLKFQYDNLDGSLKAIERNGDVFKKANGEGTLFTFGKRRSITVSGEGFRWHDRHGNWITYDKTGRVTAYGDRNNVQVSMAYGTANRLTGVFDHHGKQTLWYEYDGAGQLMAVRDRTNRQVRYTYTAGRLTTVTDVLGNAWQYTYGAESRLATRTDPEGRTTRITYDPLGRVLSVKDQDGIGTEYRYDFDRARKEYYVQIKTSGGRLEEAWYQHDGLLRRHEINGQLVQKFHTDGRKIIRTDRNSSQTIQGYDEWDNLVQQIQPDGSTVQYRYDTIYAHITQKTDENGIVTQYVYDDRGNLIQAMEAADTPQQHVTEHRYNRYGDRTETRTLGDANTAETSWTSTYDDYGNPLTFTDPEGKTSRYTYDVMGKVLTWTNPLGKVWTYAYDNAGRLLSETNPLGHTTRYAYDKVGTLRKVIDAVGYETLYEYDARNNLIRVTDAAGNSTAYAYDAHGRLVKETDQEGKSRTFVHTLDGHLRTVIDGSKNAIHLTHANDGLPDSGGFGQPSHIRYPTFERHVKYDRRNRPVLDTVVLDGSDSLGWKLSYDAVGTLISATDPEGRTTHYGYDALYNLIRVTDTLGHTTKTAYDSRNNLIAVTNALGNATRFAYDRNSRLVSETKPLGQVTTYAYDAADRLIQIIDAKGQRIAFIYDDADRQTAIRYYATGEQDTPQETVTFGYDNRGSLIRWRNGTASGAYTYDALQRLTSATFDYGPFRLSYHYTYYKNGQKKTFTGPDGVTYEYTYDANNQLTGVRIPGVGTITLTAYQWQAPTIVTLPGGTTQEYTYNSLLNIKHIQGRDPAQNPRATLMYGYSKMQLVRTKDTDFGTYTYAYDDAYRLIEATHSEYGSTHFTLDAVGNRIATDTTGAGWRYNANNQLLSQSGVTYEYDDNGNLVRKTKDATGHRYFYDIADRLIRVEAENGVIARYGYDPFGRRLWKEANGETIYFVYAEEGLIGEFDASGQQRRTYGYRPNSVWGTDPLFLKAADDHYFYHNDHLGTPIKLTAVNGTVVWSTSYSAFGSAHVQPGSSVTNNLRFPGQYYDAETGFHYNWFRYYDPVTGRYITADPTGLAEGSNLYAYVEAEPINSIDPYGLFIETGIDIAACLWSFDEFNKCPTLEAGFWVVADCLPIVLPGIVSVGVVRRADDIADVVRKSKGFNPFKGKTPEEINRMFRAKGFIPRGPDPLRGKGGYVSPRTGRSYHIDPIPRKYKKGTELPHVDVNRPKSSKSPKRKFPLGERLYE